MTFRTGTQYPAWLTPCSTIASASTSVRAVSQSTTGVITASQSGRKYSFWRCSAAFWPGPSNVRAFQPRSTAAAAPYFTMSVTGPSLPLFKMIVGRGPAAAALPLRGRKKYPCSTVPS